MCDQKVGSCGFVHGEQYHKRTLVKYDNEYTPHASFYVFYSLLFCRLLVTFCI